MVGYWITREWDIMQFWRSEFTLSIILKTFTKFSIWSKINYFLSFHYWPFHSYFTFFWHETTNGEHKFVPKTLYKFYYVETIYSPLQVSVVMAGVVSGNEKISSSCYPFLYKHTWTWFFGSTVSTNKHFVLDIHCN